MYDYDRPYTVFILAKRGTNGKWERINESLDKEKMRQQAYEMARLELMANPELKSEEIERRLQTFAPDTDRRYGSFLGSSRYNKTALVSLGTYSYARQNGGTTPAIKVQRTERKTPPREAQGSPEDALAVLDKILGS